MRHARAVVPIWCQFEDATMLKVLQGEVRSPTYQASATATAAACTATFPRSALASLWRDADKSHVILSSMRQPPLHRCHSHPIKRVEAQCINSVVDQRWLHPVVCCAIAAQRRRSVDLDEPWLERSVQHDVKSKELKAGSMLLYRLHSCHKREKNDIFDAFVLCWFDLVGFG